MARRETAARHDVREARQRRSRNGGWLDAAPYDHVADLAPPEPPRVVFQASARPPGHHPPGGAAGRRGVDSSSHGFCPHPPFHPRPSAVRRPPSRSGRVGTVREYTWPFLFPSPSILCRSGRAHVSRDFTHARGNKTTAWKRLRFARLPPRSAPAATRPGCFYVHVSSRPVPSRASSHGGVSGGARRRRGSSRRAPASRGTARRRARGGGSRSAWGWRRASAAGRRGGTAAACQRELRSRGPGGKGTCLGRVAAVQQAVEGIGLLQLGGLVPGSGPATGDAAPHGVV